MGQPYYPAKYDEGRFNCVYCGVLSHQFWHDLIRQSGEHTYDTPVRGCKCFHCDQVSYWHDGVMVVPLFASVESRHPDLPENCHTDYDEARSIVAKSPRSAAALLRLCIQKLMSHLGQSGKNINDDIGSLVGKGISTVTQRALDICRVVGNNAVHPGEIDLNDTPEIANELFRLVNVIVEELITRPREIEALYQTLPASTLKAIEQRNVKAIAATSSATAAISTVGE